MAPRADPHVTELARQYLEHTDEAPAAIALQLGVTKRTIERWRLNFEVYGTAYPPDYGHRGRPRALTTEQAQWLIAYLDERPSAYCSKLAMAVWDRFGIEICGRTVGNVIKSLRWTRKVAKQRARAQSQQLRALWQEKRSNWCRRRLVFCDKSSANLKTSWRKYAWSPKGSDAEEYRGTKKGSRYSVLPAITIDGYLPGGTLIVEGSVKRDMYLFWLQHTVLPLLTPGYHILVIDNCSTHHGDDIKPLCRSFGIQLEYLPPYSPDLNPIETTFHTLKAWIRRHAESFEADYGDFYSFLIAGVQQFVHKDCSEYYRHSGYVYEEVEQS